MKIWAQHSFKLFSAVLIYFLLPLPAVADVLDWLDINEGELNFLSETPNSPPHLQTAHIILNQDSLQTGWIEMRQCHHDIDPVGAMQIVFNKENLRSLQILQAENIGRAWIEGASVQLIDIGNDALLCTQSENRSLKLNSATNSYEWTGGPYMRRFLDGFFPVRLKLAIDYPERHMRLLTIEPRALMLNAVTVPGHIRLDTLFEGKLTITVQFIPLDSMKQGIGWE